MSIKINIKNLREDYKNGHHIINKLADMGVDKQKRIEIAYDLQAGSYTQGYFENPEIRDEPVRIIHELLLLKNIAFDSILEAGCGEANTFGLLIKSFQNLNKVEKLAFDISMSRLFYAKHFLKTIGVEGVRLFMADIMDIPLYENSVDLVYTFHSIEPNGGNEEQVIDELYRISRKYLLLIEPIFEFASKEGQERMEKNGYVKGLKNICDRKGYEVLEYQKFPFQLNPLNPTGFILIKKQSTDQKVNAFYVDPVFKDILERRDSGFYSPESGYYYPVIDDIPVLLKNQGVLVSKWNL